MNTRVKKLILIKPNGNHSNRLIQNLNFEVFCREYNIEYHNPTFNDLSEYYVSPCNSSTNSYYKFLQINLLGQIFRHSRVVKRVFSTVWIVSKFGLLKLIRFDKDIDEQTQISILLKAFEKHNVIYVTGWRFRVPKLLEKHKNESIHNYLLKNLYYSDNLLVRRLENLKSQDYIFIGVHIRRGDYKTWKGGKYYFEDSVFKQYMDKISLELSSRGKNKQMFILFSNENLNFEESENIVISKENWYIDQYIMSQCNYLIGPPSTFTFWASYISNATYIQIKEAVSSDNLILP